MPNELARQLARLRQGDHACLIYETADEQHAAVVPFVRDGLARGERCIHVASELPVEDLVGRLRAAGVDVDARRDRRALLLLTKDESYLASGAFAPEAMIALIRQWEADALRDGFRGLRFAGEMSWALDSEDMADRLRRYEVSCDALVTGSSVTLLCQYDRRRFSSPCIRDVLRTHPWTIVGSRSCRNPHHEPPELVLRSHVMSTDEAAEMRLEWRLRQLESSGATEVERHQLLESLQTLSRRLLEVQEAERRHLARELHDEVGQLLTGLRLQLKLEGQPSAAVLAARLDQARTIVDEILARVRRLSFDLRPAVLDQLGLLAALLALFERHAEQTGLLVSFKHQDIEGRFAPAVETAAYRIVQEALTNVARHAGVAGATVRVWATADTLSVDVEDRGRGFEFEQVVSLAESSGLAGMRERALLLGGHLSVASRPGMGTRITAELPVGVDVQTNA